MTSRTPQAHSAILHPLIHRRAAPPRLVLARRGFTLLELLVVIVILGLLVTMVAPSVLRQLGGARNSVVRQSIERIGGVLDLYHLDTGTYPSTEQGLQALIVRPAEVSVWNGPYVKGGLPKDPWNHDYFYRRPSQRPDHDYDLCSGGEAGTTPNPLDSNAICNP